MIKENLRAFDELCRARGLRRTAQRRAVFQALAEDPGHPTVEAIHLRLAAAFPTLPLPTVYRIAGDLLAAGLIRRVASDEGPARLDANLERHQHLVCRACGRMRDCQVPALGALPLPAGLPAGFSPEGYDIRITGLCAHCASKRRPTQRRKP